MKIQRNALTDLRAIKIEPTGLGSLLDVDDKRREAKVNTSISDLGSGVNSVLIQAIWEDLIYVRGGGDDKSKM